MDFCITKEFIEHGYQSENPLDVDDPDDDYNSFDEIFAGIDDSELNKRFRIRVIKKIFEHSTEVSIINYLTNELLHFNNKELTVHIDFTTHEDLLVYRDNYTGLAKNLGL